MNSNLLSAASLALAALAVMYGMWGSDMSRARNLQKPEHREDREPMIAQLRDTLHQKATPLLIASSVVAIVLAPPAAGVVWRSVAHIIAKGPIGIADYNASQTLFLVVWLMMCGLAVVMFDAWRALWSRARSFARSDSVGHNR